MPSAEELKARFEGRLRPGPTDERLAASLGLLPAPAEPEPQSSEPPSERGGEVAAPKRAPGNAKPRRQPVRLVSAPESGPTPQSGNGAGSGKAATEAETDGGGVGLDALSSLFPAPEPLVAAAGPEPVKVGFPVPVDLIRDVTRLKVDLSRHLGRRLSNHEIGAAAAELVPADPADAAEQVRRHAERVGLTDPAGTARRRLVAAIPQDVATALEDLVLAIDATENVRVTKSQLWALAHVLLLERAGR
jgi:hypothetical protein